MQEPWKTDKWFSSPWSYLPEVRQKQAFGSNLKIHDVTLRDGEQQTAVVFRREEKVAIAKKLDSLGIHRIEAGIDAAIDRGQAAREWTRQHEEHERRSDGYHGLGERQ